MPKTLVKGDKWNVAFRLTTGESLSTSCEVDDDGAVVAHIDGSTAVIRVYTLDGSIVGQYIDNYIMRAIVCRRSLLFTQDDVTMLLALVLSAVEESPGVQIVPPAAMSMIDFDSDPLF